ncbi:unnamed protein product [Rhodiola kirilowii]
MSCRVAKEIAFMLLAMGEFEVLATQEDKDREVPRVLQKYSAEKLSSFGELALMYNKPLQASVQAVTKGTLWALRREDFRGILMSEFSNLSSLKLLRSVDLLSRLTILQLSHIADSLSVVSFSNGQTIINKKDYVDGLYVIQKGQVEITFNSDILKSHNVSSLIPDSASQDDELQNNVEITVQKKEGSYFGEWALIGEELRAVHVTAVGDVTCAVLTKETFDSVVGPLTKLSQNDQKTRANFSDMPKESIPRVGVSKLEKVQLSDLEWKTCLYSTDCSEIGVVLLRDFDKLLSLKRFLKPKIKNLGKEAHVLKEKNLMKSLKPSPYIPQVICTCADQIYAGMLLDTCLGCPLASILHTPFDEPTAQFCAALVVSALEDLHMVRLTLFVKMIFPFEDLISYSNSLFSLILLIPEWYSFRGISPDVLMLDQAGHLQLVDFRFGKKLNEERTFTMCGMVDSLAPEMVQGKGHSFPSDWWAVGVLIYFMLQGEMPFGSWREGELDTYAKIAKGQLNLPETLSPSAIDLITKLLEVDENTRLGSQGAKSVKTHPWFNNIDWIEIKNGRFHVPLEITSRITQHLESRTQDSIFAPASPFKDVDELNTPEWLEDW